jgi:hypothetical protein
MTLCDPYPDIRKSKHFLMYCFFKVNLNFILKSTPNFAKLFFTFKRLQMFQIIPESKHIA